MRAVSWRNLAQSAAAELSRCAPNAVHAAPFGPAKFEPFEAIAWRRFASFVHAHFGDLLDQHFV